MFRMNHSACLFGASLRDANSVFIQGFTERESLRDCLKPTIGMNVAKYFDGERYKGLPETCRRHGRSVKYTQGSVSASHRDAPYNDFRCIIQ